MKFIPSGRGKGQFWVNGMEKNSVDKVVENEASHWKGVSLRVVKGCSCYGANVNGMSVRVQEQCGEEDNFCSCEADHVRRESKEPMHASQQSLAKENVSGFFVKETQTDSLTRVIKTGDRSYLLLFDRDPERLDVDARADDRFRTCSTRANEIKSEHEDGLFEDTQRLLMQFFVFDEIMVSSASQSYARKGNSRRRKMTSRSYGIVDSD